MKLVLCCQKRKPYLFDSVLDCYPDRYGLYDKEEDCDSGEEALNGKIVGECDYEIEKLESRYFVSEYEEFKNICKESCLSLYELIEITKKDKLGFELSFYAIHIKNLKIYDKPRELNTCSNYIPVKSADGYCYYNPELKKCPKKMMYVWHFYDKTDNPELSYRILLPLTSKELFNILNGRQTIIVKRNVLKEMI